MDNGEGPTDGKASHRSARVRGGGEVAAPRGAWPGLQSEHNRSVLPGRRIVSFP